MYINIQYDRFKSDIHIWKVIDGKRVYEKIKWVPYCFKRTPKENTKIKTVDGLNVIKKEFKTFSEYNNFCKNNKNNEDIYEDFVQPEIQYLSEKYHKIPMEDIILPDLLIYSIDIEVNSESGMPNPMEALHPITAITVMNFKTKKPVTFGIKEYTGENKYNTDYYYCDTEEKLLSNFLQWWTKNYPDVITGWNIASDNKVNIYGGFDLPYIINRLENLFPDKNLYKLLSPIQNVYWRNRNDNMDINIGGISIIDYLSIYKWYSKIIDGKNLEKYTLERVAQEELDEGKEDFGDNFDLRDMYNNDYNTYIDYNIKDTLLINKFEEKLQYIKLAQYLTLLCKCPLNSYNATTKLVEGLMLTRFRRYNKCAPKFKGGNAEPFDAAYVKKPIPNLYGWSFSIDIQSSYPHAIISLNMSPEKLIGKISGYNHKEIIDFVWKKEFPSFEFIKNDDIKTISGNELKEFNSFVKNKHISIAPNGAVFSNIGRGVYAKMEIDVYKKRKETKRKISVLLKKDDPSLDWKISQLNIMQKALKIILNGAFGATAVGYSRYFCPDMAEAIPSVGKEALLAGERYANEIFNNIDNYKELKEILDNIKNNY